MPRILFLALVFACSTVVGAAESFDVLSINVRLSTAKDGEDAWPNRRDAMMDLVRSRPYDFIGGQEVVVHPDDELNQVKFMAAKLPEYGVLFRSRERSEAQGEGMPVFYRKDRWEPDEKEQGFFWLSDTPDVPASITWEGQSRCPRIVTWALFHRKDAEGKRAACSVYVFCTHFDHIGNLARQKAAEMIARRIADRAVKAAPVVLMGDLNSGEDSPAIRYLKGETVELDGRARTSPIPMRDTFRVLYPDEKDVSTFQGFKAHNPKGAKIDYIFVTPDLETLEAEIIRAKAPSGRFPTDHYPVRARLAGTSKTSAPN